MAIIPALICVIVSIVVAATTVKPVRRPAQASYKRR